MLANNSLKKQKLLFQKQHLPSSHTVVSKVNKGIMKDSGVKYM